MRSWIVGRPSMRQSFSLFLSPRIVNMSSGEESLSPAVSSDDFPAFAEAKIILEERLARYAPLDRDDDTAEFLRIVFTYLPVDGQVHLVEDLQDCDDEGLRQLDASIDTGLLRPMLARGAATPAVTPSPRLGRERSIETFVSYDIESITRADQRRLRTNCLERDGHRCVLSKLWNPNFPNRPPNEPKAPLEAAHIIPFALGTFRSNDPDSRERHATIWVNIHRYFPALRSRLHFTSEHVNREANVMMLLSPLHGEFGEFRLTFEATQTENRYRVKVFPNFNDGYNVFLPPNRIVTFMSHDSRWHLPNPFLLQVHVAIANILHLSGRGEKIETLKRDLGDMNGGLAPNGSTEIGDLLSVSRLSLLSSANKQARPTGEEKQRTPTMLPGGENQWPRTG